MHKSKPAAPRSREPTPRSRTAQQCVVFVTNYRQVWHSAADHD